MKCAIRVQKGDILCFLKESVNLFIQNLIQDFSQKCPGSQIPGSRLFGTLVTIELYLQIQIDTLHVLVPNHSEVYHQETKNCQLMGLSYLVKIFIQWELLKNIFQLPCVKDTIPLFHLHLPVHFSLYSHNLLLLTLFTLLKKGKTDKSSERLGRIIVV